MARRRGLLAAALAVLWAVLAAVPGGPGVSGVPGAAGPVEAANPWTIALSPTALAVGVATNVTATVTDGDNEIGCLVLDLPAGFTVVSASVSSVPAGFVWHATVSGSGPTHVTFSTTKDAWRLNGGDQGVFVVRVVATTAPLPAWSARAYKKFTADSKQRNSGPLVVPGPFSIASASTPTASPTPTPKPISTPGPTATLKPTAVPTPTPRSNAAPTAAPSHSAPAGIDPSASPADSTVSATPATADASPSNLTIAGVAAVTGPAGSGGVGETGGFETTVDVLALPAGGTVELDNQVGGIGMFAWVVPGLFLSLPGLLLFLVVLAQGAFATVFVPVTRRVLGLGHRRHSQRPAALR